MTPATTLQESLAALFEIPVEIAVQLVIKHPALACVPPNATITKAKGMSLALGCTMQVDGEREVGRGAVQYFPLQPRSLPC